MERDAIPGNAQIGMIAAQEWVMTAARIEAVLAAAKRLRENPLFHDYVRDAEECHRVNNGVPDSD